MSVKAKALDLTKEFPASPKLVYGGYVHLARMRDKARAKAAGTLGEYHYPCPLDKGLLGFLGIAPEAFIDAAQRKNDDELLVWVKQNVKPESSEEIKQWSDQFLTRKPDSPETLAYFLETRNRLNPKRTDVETWVDLLDLEEGRLG
ncbi:MAG: DUF5069 domain-containing protein [Nitrospiria bacterium]